MKIPKENRDLKRYVLRKDLIRALGFALWMVVWYSGAVAYNLNHKTYPPERQMIGWKLCLWMAIAAVIGTVIFRIWRFFTDKTYRGRIVSNDNSRSYTQSQDPGSAEYDFRLNTKLKILDDDGKVHRTRRTAYCDRRRRKRRQAPRHTAPPRHGQSASLAPHTPWVSDEKNGGSDSPWVVLGS